MRCEAAIVILAISISGTAVAQAPSIAVGARVRVTAPSQDLTKYVATVVEVRGDTLALAGKGGVRRVPFAGVTNLQVSTGRRSRVVRDAAIGLGAGFVAGAIVGAASYEEPSFFTESATEEAALVGSLFGAAGLVVGGVVGIFHRTDRWEDRALPVRASVRGLKAGGIALNISRAF